MIAVFKIKFSVLSKCASKLNSFSSEDIGNKLSLRAGSPLGHARERRRTKAIRGGGVESGEALAGTPRTLALQREPPCKLKQADMGENVTKTAQIASDRCE